MKTNSLLSMIEVIEDKKPWDNFIDSFEDADLYHTYDYHMVAKGKDRPILLKYVQGDISIGLPLLIRQIPNSSYYDATSVYGYPGPLYKNLTKDFNNLDFKEALLEYFELNNIISVFSRLNPFLHAQNKILEHIGICEKKGGIVSIDLTKDVDLQRREFGKRLKGQLNKARRHCTIKKATTDEELKVFIDIYHQNMDRVNAKSMYYFDDAYFKTIAKSNSFDTETLLAIHNDTGEIIGASMFFHKNSVIHYHLSGTKDEYLPLMPTKLLIDEMRIKATYLGLENFNLGGGLSSANDSLLQFKTSFSKNQIDFYVWKLVVNPEVYNNLIGENNLETSTDFFPLYRYASHR